MREIARRIAGVLQENCGAETLEWILIGGLIVGAAIAIYPGALTPGLNAVVGTVVGTIAGAI